MCTNGNYDVTKDPQVDPQHCVIEFCDCENKIVLTDIKSTRGTYVNGCKVQNSLVEINHGDVVQFGKQGTPMRLVVNNYVSCCSLC